jgi:hypothetical protein
MKEFCVKVLFALTPLKNRISIIKFWKIENLGGKFMKQKKWHGLVPAIAVLALLLVPFSMNAQSEEEIIANVTLLNDQLAASGAEVRIAVAEIMTNDGAGQTVYFDNRSKQLGHHWVPGDPRRGGYTDISWISDLWDGSPSGLTLAQTQAAIDSAMNTWQTADCSTIPLTKLPDYGLDWGYLQYLVGFGGTYGWFADITNAGWLPGIFFDILLGSGAQNSVLGVTFSFTWVNTTTGEPTDIDNNGKSDVAFREIYYNDNFAWAVDGINHIDVETVVLHENGHGLSQGHFGKAFRTIANGKLHFAPLAVMNAGYTGVQQSLLGTDNGGHCSIWGSWPNN